ncbi:hypothetical protein DCAR_0934668 [Daucus carota subsp. sativus]|uniref:Uncharacterized protein n=1 Tax=Daucus carota subsp. sativus TaxID=79200 RepID=A0AAF0XVL9_DAUCS|nr:hypothetical protein DCAR_0934668 [Daucus carota subsp. sativus]
MHEDNQFGRGRTLLWISDHILHRALLSLPSPSSGYGSRRRRNREEGISNNRFYYGTAHEYFIFPLGKNEFVHYRGDRLISKKMMF